MTTEQIIVIGFIAAAFVAGWIASLVIRRRARRSEAPAMPAPVNGAGPAAHAAPAADTPLAEQVGDALRSDTANEGMFSVVRAGGEPGLSELELDLADWGFTYGVAWARARERAPGGSDEAVAQEALDVAERVFRAYTGGSDWTRPAPRDRADANGSDAPDEPA